MKTCLLTGLVGFEFNGPSVHAVTRSLTTLFSRRYLPDPELDDSCNSIDVEVMWIDGRGFNVLAAWYSRELLHQPDRYIIEGGPAEPYTNESPVFFVLQALARRLIIKGQVLLTDSVSIYLPSTGEAVLLLGYPHTGKSTISSIAFSKGFTVLSTENTIVDVDEKGLLVRSGSSTLVFDPVVRRLYGVELLSHETTRHGYEVVDAGSTERSSLLRRGVRVSSIYVLHTNFSSSGVSLTPVKGRKIGKTLWYFATSVLRGVDFYEPAPLDIPMDYPVKNNLLRFLENAQRNYNGRMLEVYGSPLEVFNEIIAREASQR
ncbi:MAG: hypothetical protein OWQ48_05485 [Desulfurococcus sp.]|nr:hypothetical protein [Desulfurococcus sp.]